MSFPKGTRPEDTRAVDVSIDIDKSVDEVWPFLSTSEGMSSWYVGVDFAEQRAGAAVTLNFGAGMTVPCRVEAYDHHERVRIGPPEGVDSPRVEEYRVAAREGGGCTVRIVNWGFGDGADWDAEYDAVKKGWGFWGLFLGVLKLVVERFGAYGPGGRSNLLAQSADASAAWVKLTNALGGEPVRRAKVGDRLVLGHAPSVEGVVDIAEERMLRLSLDDGRGGIIVLAAVEGTQHVMASISLWSFGARKSQAAELEAAWGSWFRQAFPA
jgi:uncharacterized protein YndB with AHSA1/START domain